MCMTVHVKRMRYTGFTKKKEGKWTKKCGKWRQYLLLCWMTCCGRRQKSTCYAELLFGMWTWIHEQICTHVSTHKHTETTASCSFRGSCMKRNTHKQSLKLKSCLTYIAWPLRNHLFSGSQLSQKLSKQTACLTQLKCILYLCHNIFDVVGPMRCDDKLTQQEIYVLKGNICLLHAQNSQNPHKETRNITEQFSICLKALTWLQGQILPSVQGWIVSSIKYPPRNGDGSFLADTSSPLPIGQDVDLALVQVGETKGDGQGKEDRIRESRMGGEEREM